MKDSPFEKVQLVSDSTVSSHWQSAVVVFVFCFFQTLAQQLQTTARQHFVVIFRMYSIYSGGRESGFTTTVIIVDYKSVIQNT